MQCKAHKTDIKTNKTWQRLTKTRHCSLWCHHGGHRHSFTNCLWLLLKIRHSTKAPPF